MMDEKNVKVELTIYYAYTGSTLYIEDRDDIASLFLSSIDTSALKIEAANFYF